mmetsp:Transcript_49442/g.67275  ORF Transcript_49442/g.67275 Transcript_49442/m.67275 type:complete len:230 (+) Transcript_49442:925-1614(+)
MIFLSPPRKSSSNHITSEETTWRSRLMSCRPKCTIVSRDAWSTSSTLLTWIENNTKPPTSWILLALDTQVLLKLWSSMSMVAPLSSRKSLVCILFLNLDTTPMNLLEIRKRLSHLRSSYLTNLSMRMLIWLLRWSSPTSTTRSRKSTRTISMSSLRSIATIIISQSSSTFMMTKRALTLTSWPCQLTHGCKMISPLPLFTSLVISSEMVTICPQLLDLSVTPLPTNHLT